MADDIKLNNEKSQFMIYQIRIKGHLDHNWSDWFSGLSITALDSGDTVLTGPVIDQAALHSLLRKIRDVGLPLLSVIHVEPEQRDALDIES